MKSVLISIQPKWCELIASGKKTVEVRKTRPKLETPFKVYIYCTLPPKEELFTQGCIREYEHELIRLQDGRIVYDYGMRLCYDIENRPYSSDNFLCKKVIGEFVCDRIIDIPYSQYFVDYYHTMPQDDLEATCLDMGHIDEYLLSKSGYGWHISDLVIYDKPRELSEFYAEGDCDCMNCKKCYWFDRGNDYNVEDDCFLAYKGVGNHKSFKPIIRPPQSWCYVESEDAK